MHVVHTIPLGCFSTCLRHPAAQKELQHCGGIPAAEATAAAAAAPGSKPDAAAAADAADIAAAAALGSKVPRFTPIRFALRTCDGVKAPLGGDPHEDADDDPNPKSALVGCMVGNPTKWET
jgi:hypothetical protein